MRRQSTAMTRGTRDALPRGMVDALRAWIIRPVVFFPLLAGLAVLLAYVILQGGLAQADRWDRDRATRHEAHRPQVLVERYETRLREVRLALRKRGYNAGPVDAIMGSQTAEALRAFQQRQGLPVTGRADPTTMIALGVEP
jgi:hypothetical protein